MWENIFHFFIILFCFLLRSFFPVPHQQRKTKLKKSRKYLKFSKYYCNVRDDKINANHINIAERIFLIPNHIAFPEEHFSVIFIKTYSLVKKFIVYRYYIYNYRFHHSVKANQWNINA